MKSILSFITRWVRKLRTKLFPIKFPKRIVLSDITPDPLIFVVHSPVEHYRIAHYGGERDTLKYFLTVLKKDDIVYDIGASVGLYTVVTASYVRNGEVYAFEPDPETRENLKANVALNRLDNVHYIPWAVSNDEGEVVLYTNGAAGFAPSLIKQNRKSAPTGQITVSTCSLDMAIMHDKLPAPDVLKVDIEGAEALCLDGCKRLLSGAFGKQPRVLFLELHPDFLHDFGTSAKEIKNRISGLGYTIVWSKTRDTQEHLCYITE